MSRSRWNPPNRFGETHVEWDEPESAPTVVIEDGTREVLVHNDSPDVGFSWSVNPYRGCTHACAYCYARGFHEYLGLGAGADFESVLLVKPDAPRLLQRAFERPSWRGERVAMSGVTDCYQALERRHRLTRGCLEVCARFANPVSITTRSPLVARDADLLAELRDIAWVAMSVPIPEPSLCRALEPGAPSPGARFRAMEPLALAGVSVGIMVCPIIPGLNEAMVPEVLARASDAGAGWATLGLVNLTGAVAEVFERRLAAVLPHRVPGVLARIRRAHGGGLRGRFGHRRHGHDTSWEATVRLFTICRERLGLGDGPPDQSAAFRPRQPGLFDPS